MRIEAFVAHSFKEEDQGLVRTFLDFLTVVSETNSEFSWDHAQGAKPLDLRQKVLEKIEGKNVLVAICTRHKLVVNPRALRTRLLSTRRYAEEAEMAWVTSEWVVQEIGLGIGRGMDLVILLEESVTPPGGMQGNVEYMPFHRDSPEKAFPALMQMIGSLTSKGERLAHPAIAASQPEVDGSGMPAPGDGAREYESLESYERAYLLGLLRNAENVQEIEASFLASPFATSTLARARWSARKEWWKQLLSQSGDLKHLGRLRNEFPTDPIIAVAEARILENLGEGASALASYRVAIDHAETNANALAWLAASAAIYIKEGRRKETDQLIDEARSRLSKRANPEEEHSFAVEFAPVLSGRSFFGLALKERALEGGPDDHNGRFDLAHDYSEQKLDALALYHYVNIPERKRSPEVWNNLGVAAQAVGLTGLAATSYKQAVADGNTLAVSNLANMLVRAGMFEDAERMCRDALAKDDCDANVGSTLSSLVETKKQEQSSLEKNQTNARAASNFMKDVGRALAASPAGSLVGRWSSSDGIFDCTEDGADLRFIGLSKRPTSALRRLSIVDPPREETIRVTIKTERSGNALDGTMVRETEGLPTLLGAEPEKRLVGVISNEGNVIRFLEIAASDAPSFYELRRILALSNSS